MTPAMADVKRYRSRILFGDFAPANSIDFEAAQDHLSRLAVTIEFPGPLEDMPRETLPQDRELWPLTFRLRSAVNVVYSPEAQLQLGELYTEACRLIGRECDYSHYTGFGRTDDRALKRREEWALKWATFHAVPDLNFTGKYHDPFYDGVTADLLKLFQGLRMAEAKRIIFSVFDPANAEVLNSKLVSPFIVRGFKELAKVGF